MRLSAERGFRIAALAAVIALGCGGKQSVPADPAAAPDFLLGTAAGKNVMLHNLAGTPAALFFVIPGTGVCDSLLARVRQRAAVSPRTSCRMITVSRSTSMPGSVQVQADAPLFEVTDTGALFSAYGVTRVPTLIGINSSGIRTARREGYGGSAAEIDTFINSLSAGAGNG